MGIFMNGLNFGAAILRLALHGLEGDIPAETLGLSRAREEW